MSHQLCGPYCIQEVSPLHHILNTLVHIVWIIGSGHDKKLEAAKCGLGVDQRIFGSLEAGFT